MTTSDMIRELCEKQNISLAELSRRIGQTLQNFKKNFNERLLMQRKRLKLLICLALYLNKDILQIEK